jgi:hypothetical protein|nr:MAG TPA: hypothetical protein [Caudoviricetes sp.]
MFHQKPLTFKNLSKHKILKHFLETADNNCICRYYDDPYFQNISNAVLLNYIHELSDDGYLKSNIRHVVLTAKAYSYMTDRRNTRIKTVLLHLARPVSYFLSWIFGIASGVLVEYLIRHFL